MYIGVLENYYIFYPLKACKILLLWPLINYVKVYYAIYRIFFKGLIIFISLFFLEQFALILYFKLPPCSDCCMLSSG